MKTKITTTLGLLAALLLGGGARAFGLGTAFSYHGLLSNTNGPLNGSFDLRFALFDAPAAGNPAPAPILTNIVILTNGVLATDVDFGPGVFNGQNYWLEVSTRPTGGGAFNLLTPRQAILAAPNATYAAVAGAAQVAAGVASNAITGLAIQEGSIPASKIVAGQVVTAVNGLAGNVQLAVDSSLALSTNGNQLMLKAPPGQYWNLFGNSGTTAANFLGTTDNQPLEMRVNNTRAYRIVPTSDSPQLIGGSSANSIAPNLPGSTIAGGGSTSAAFPNQFNQIHAAFATIGGGRGNNIQSNSDSSVIVGGANNTNYYAEGSVIGGGGANIQNESSYGTIAGGYFNTISTSYGTIGGGLQNLMAVQSFASTIAGGYQNSIYSEESAIGGGFVNLIGLSSPNSTIAGGLNNIVGTNALGSSIGGGIQNSAFAPLSQIAGGQRNFIDTNAAQSTIGGGATNSIFGSAFSAVIAGGDGNQIQPPGNYSVLGGGLNNSCALDFSVVAGGIANATMGSQATIGGGAFNTNTGNAATVSGGQFNFSGGPGAAIPGGSHNLALGKNSLAAGQQAQALQDSTFVFGDSQNAAFASTGPDQFCIRAKGGIQVDPTTSLFFGSQTRQMLNLYGSTYGLGVQNGALFFRTDATYSGHGGFSWFRGGTFNTGENNAGGGMEMMRLDSTGLLTVNGRVLATSGGGDSNPQLAVDQSNTTDYARLRFTVGGNTAQRWVAAANASSFVLYSAQYGANMLQLDNTGLTVKGTFVSTSDRAAKENFQAVNTGDILDKVAALPLSRWNYKQDTGGEHIGPMAQDFYAAFGTGADDKHIAVVDEGGVALAAIQGLNEKLNTQSRGVAAELEALRLKAERVDRLEREISELREFVRAMKGGK